ncbi:natterin-3-like [Cottoperca gobio]|uniref:Natterin-3-like n=1 Tax=Cottoperca gobio TaxID=56716 RepID=A0A6J2QF51_COTGO|nr:natterin-3-like [Cottoperca gobio]
MKLSVLILLVLLALCSASLQDSSHHKNVSTLDLAPEDRTHDITSDRTTLTPRFLLSSLMLRKKRQAQPSTLFGDSANLKWVKWDGSLPNGSVSIYNQYAKRFDYVCMAQCEAGFYNSAMGSTCHYPLHNKELRSLNFEILVNKNEFEVLEWKHGSYGSVPQHPVRTCSSTDIYVAKNKYGLGKVHARHKAFFLPWKGSEYFYKYYQVLTISQDVYSEHIYDVKYNINGAVLLKYPPETMHITVLTNNECKSVLKICTLSKTSRSENRWDTDFSLKFGVKRSFSGGVPNIASGGIEVSGEVSFTFKYGQTWTEESSHSIAVEVSVSPQHICKVRMLGYKYKADIPFTARLRRTYRDGKTTWTSTSGTYNSVQIGEVHTVVERCQPLSDVIPCPIAIN